MGGEIPNREGERIRRIHGKKVDGLGENAFHQHNNQKGRTTLLPGIGRGGRERIDH